MKNSDRIKAGFASIDLERLDFLPRLESIEMLLIFDARNGSIARLTPRFSFKFDEAAAPRLTTPPSPSQ